MNLVKKSYLIYGIIPVLGLFGLLILVNGNNYYHKFELMNNATLKIVKRDTSLSRSDVRQVIEETFDAHKNKLTKTSKANASHGNFSEYEHGKTAKKAAKKK